MANDEKQPVHEILAYLFTEDRYFPVSILTQHLKATEAQIVQGIQDYQEITGFVILSKDKKQFTLTGIIEQRLPNGQSEFFKTLIELIADIKEGKTEVKQRLIKKRDDFFGKYTRGRGENT